MSPGFLERAYLRARDAWPGVELPREAFEAHLGARAEPGIAEDKLHTDDLYLAAACLRGDRAALAAFEAAHGGALAATLSRHALTSGERDDVLQGLRVAFFVKGSVAGYSGRGALRGWARSAATRAALDALAARRRRPDDEEEILGNLPATGDPELELVRRRFAAEFRAAFAESMAALAADDRLVLAQHYIDRLAIDQLAAVLGVHRATAARRIVRLRDALLEGTRARLQERLAVDAQAPESLMRAASSRLEVSVFRLMRR